VLHNDGQIDLDKGGHLVTIDTMAIHDTQHPQIINAVEVLLNDETVLVDLAHLGDVACARLVRDGLDELTLAGY
jgi:hypothetical protein